MNGGVVLHQEDVSGPGHGWCWSLSESISEGALRTLTSFSGPRPPSLLRHAGHVLLHQVQHSQVVGEVGLSNGLLAHRALCELLLRWSQELEAAVQQISQVESLSLQHLNCGVVSVAIVEYQVLHVVTCIPTPGHWTLAGIADLALASSAGKRCHKLVLVVTETEMVDEEEAVAFH